MAAPFHLKVGFLTGPASNGMELNFTDFIRLLIQLSLAVAGASAFWGYVLTRRAKKDPGHRSEYEKIIEIVAKIFTFSSALFLLFWFYASTFVFQAISSAHEGIKIDPTNEYIRAGFSANLFFVAIFSAIVLFGINYLIFHKAKFQKLAGKFFFVQFLLITVIISLQVLKQSFDKEQFFFILHNFHSIFTLASVVLIDILYLTTFRNNSLKPIIYNFFPWISVGIWTGLGLDFASVFLILPEALILSPQFFFSQTVVAIIILNGTLLSSRVNDYLLDSLRPVGARKFPTSFKQIFHWSGSISIVSWLTIYFVDFFKFNLSFLVLFLTYIALIFLARAIHEIINRKFLENSFIEEKI